MITKKKNLYNTTTATWVKNISDTQLPEHIQGYLALGPKFSLPISPKEVDIFRLISEIESIITCIPVGEQDLVRSRATNLVTNFIHFNSYFQPPSQDLENETKRFLKNHLNLIVTKSDKGNVTVIMNKNAYTQKSLELLKDTDPYKLINKDPTNLLETSCNRLIKKLKVEVI